MKFLAYCRFPDKFIYTSGIPEQLSISAYAHTMADGRWPGQAQAQTPPNIQSLYLFCFFNAEGISTLWRVSKW